MGLIQLTNTVSPVTLAEAKVQCKLDPTDTSEDSLLNGYLVAATRFCEQRTHRAFMQSTWRWTGKNFPTRLDSDLCWRVPVAPLVSVTSVQYWSGTLQTLNASNYIVDTTNIPGRIQFNSMPSVDDRPEAVQINFVAGYGASGADDTAQRAAVPQEIDNIILMLVGTYYDNRQTMMIDGTVDSRLQDWVDSQLSHYFLPF